MSENDSRAQGGRAHAGEERGSIGRSRFAVPSGALALFLVAAGAVEVASDERIAAAQAPAPPGRVVVLTGYRLTIADIVAIADGRANVEMSADGIEPLSLPVDQPYDLAPLLEH